MTVIRRISRIGALIVLCAAATGCIVLPFGAGHGRHGRGERHYVPHSDGSWSGHHEPRERHRHGGY